MLVAGVVASGAAMAAPASEPLSCLSGFRSSLVRGHFTGPLVCSGKDATFLLVGRTAGDIFSIYDYRYRYLPAGGSVMHGGQKLIVFHGKVYVGQYALSPPPYVTVTVNGSKVVLKTRGRKQVKLDFSRKPPGQIMIGGEVETFSR